MSERLHLNPTELGSSVRVARKGMGITAKNLAKEIGISRAYIYRIELGIANPSVKIAEQLRETLKLDDIGRISQAILSRNRPRGSVIYSDLYVAFLLEKELTSTELLRLTTLERVTLINLSPTEQDTSIKLRIDNHYAFFAGDNKNLIEESAKPLDVNVSYRSANYMRQYSEEELRASTSEEFLCKFLELTEGIPAEETVDVQLGAQQLVSSAQCLTFFKPEPIGEFTLLIIHPEDVNIATYMPLGTLQELLSSPQLSLLRSKSNEVSYFKIAWAPVGTEPSLHLGGGG